MERYCSTCQCLPHIYIVARSPNIQRAKGEIVHINLERIKVKSLRDFKVEESMYEIECSHWALIMRWRNLRQALKRFESQRSSFNIQEGLLSRYNDKSNVKFERTTILDLSSLATLNAKQLLVAVGGGVEHRKYESNR